MLFNFFKPKWQNQKPEVRIRAIQELSSAAPETSDILKKLAFTDPDTQVRLTAVAHLSDITQLCSLIRSEPDSDTLHTARNRLCHLLVEDDCPLQQQTAALALLQDSALLTHLVLNSDKAELQQQALELITDQYACATIVRKSNLAQLRRSAAEKINEPDLLEALYKETLGKDKGVNRIFKQQLQQLQEAEQAHEAQLQRCSTLVQSLEQLARGEYFPQFGAKLQALKTEWSTISSVASDALGTRADHALEQAELRLAHVQAQAEAERMLQAQRQAKKIQRDQLREGLDSCISELNRFISADLRLDPALQAQLANLAQVYDSLPEASRQDTALKAALSQAKALQDGLTALDEARAAIDALIAKTESDTGSADEAGLLALKQALTQEIARLTWPRNADTPNLILRAKAALVQINTALQAHKATHKTEFAQLESHLDELEGALGSGHSRKAERLMKLVEQHAEGVKLPRLQEQRLRSAQARLTELREWQGFAVAPKKEALCAEMEALVDTALEPQQLALRIKELQKQWKLLDATDSVHSHAIWKRFKQASDRAYEPCEAYFSEQKQQRELNLEKREQLCAQLQEKLNQSGDAEPDWKALDSLIKNAKREWKTLSPVDRSPGKKVQTRFNELLAQLEAPLKAYRQHNADQKRIIIGEVKALLQDDHSDCIETVKQLQQQWKEIGPTFRSTEQKLWQQFRELCSDVFDHYHQSRRDRNTRLEQTLAPIEQACTSLEQALTSKTGYTELRALLDQSDALLDGSDCVLPTALLNRLSALQQEARQSLKALHELRSQDSESLQRRAVLCEQLEVALLEGGAEEVADELDAVWPQSDNQNLPYIEQMEARYARLRTLCNSPLEALKADIEASEVILRQLCIRLEIAMGEPSPVEDQALRMEYQMQRLQQALAQQDAAINIKEIQTLQCEWLCVPFACYYPELSQRFYALMDSVQ